MARFYINSAGAGTFTNEEGTEQVWAIGNDGNDGSTPLLAYLNYETAVVAHTAIDDEFEFNAGTYTYNINDGRWQPNRDGVKVFGTELDTNGDCQTILSHTGSNILGIQIRTPNVPAVIHIGCVLIQCSSAKTAPLSIANTSAGAIATTLTLGCQMDYYEGIGQFYNDTFSAGSVTFKNGFGVRGGSTQTTASTFGCVRMIGIVNAAVIIECFDVEGFEGNFQFGGMHIGYTENNTAPALVSSGFRGTANPQDLGSVQEAVMLDVVNAPDGSEHDWNLPFTVNAPASQTQSYAATVFNTPSASTIVSDALRVHSSTGALVTIGSTAGRLVAMGLDSSTDEGITDSVIENLNMSSYGANNGGDVGSMHGIAHFGCDTGTRQNNTINGCQLPDLTKENGSSVVSQDNTYTGIGTGAQLMYAKGTQAGATFQRNRAMIDNNFSGTIEQIQRNQTTATMAAGAIFLDNEVIAAGGDFLSNAKPFKMGESDNAADTSTGTTTNLAIDFALTDPDNFAVITTVGFTTLAAANDETEVTNMHKYDPAATPVLTTPYANRMNISGDVVSAIDFSEGWVGASSFVITGLPNGLIATGASVAGTVIAPTGTFTTNIAATNSAGTTNAQFQWTTLTTGINANINAL